MSAETSEHSPINWTGNGGGVGLVTAIKPRRKAGQDGMLDWELDIVVALGDRVAAESLETSLPQLVTYYGRAVDAESSADLKIRPSSKDIHVTLETKDLRLQDVGAEIRFIKARLTENAQVQAAKITLKNVKLSLSEDICTMLGENVEVTVQQDQGELLLLPNALPDVGQLVSGLDSGGKTRIGLVLRAEAGAIQIEDFRDLHVIKSVVTSTEVMSQDDSDIDELLSRYSDSMEDLGGVASWDHLMTVVMQAVAEGLVNPPTANTLYMSEDVVGLALAAPEASNG